MEQTEQNSIRSLAKRVSELAERQTSHGSVPQGEFVEAIQRLQVAVEGPAHYVARMRHQVRDHVLPVHFRSKLNGHAIASRIHQYSSRCRIGSAAGSGGERREAAFGARAGREDQGGAASN
jgi:hypothetical protein